MCLMAATATCLMAQVEIPVEKQVELPGQAKPILVSMSGLTGEAATTLQFDLYVQGFAFTNAEAAQYLITGSNNGNLQARATDPHNKSTLVSKAYSGVALRRQAHAFADDFVQALGRKGIAQTKIAFKGENSPHSEIYVADFDGHNAQAVTKDNSIVAAPCWVPGHLALYYVSYKLDHTDIFYHDLSTGARRAFARYGGSNMSPAASPGGSKVAMILSKDGWVDLYVCDADGSEPEAADQVAAGRVLALLVAGWQMDLFRGQGERAPDALQSARLGRGAADNRHRRHAEPHRSRIGRRTASGSRSRRNTGPVSRSAWCRPTAAPRRCWSKAKTRPGRRIPGRWLTAGGKAGIMCSPCLTCRRNNTKMFPGFRELAHNHNPVGPNKPVHERQENETEQVCQPVGDRISPHRRSLRLPEEACQPNAAPGAMTPKPGYQASGANP